MARQTGAQFSWESAKIDKRQQTLLFTLPNRQHTRLRVFERTRCLVAMFQLTNVI